MATVNQEGKVEVEELIEVRWEACRKKRTNTCCWMRSKWK